MSALRRLALPLLALLAGCPKPAPGPSLSPETLALPPVPEAVAHVVWVEEGATLRAPARLEVLSERDPTHLRLEDFDRGEVFEVLIESLEPPRFGRAPGASGPDQGTVSRDGSRTALSLQRPQGSGTAPLTVTIDRTPEPVAPPSAWLRPGTVLFYGLTFDDKPITKVVPLALTVRMGAGSDGSRVLTWKADIDPLAEQQYTTERTRTGRKLIPPEVVQSGVRVDDRFARGEDIPDANSLFLSRAQLQGVTQVGGASLQDEEVGAQGVLVRAFDLDVDVQADAGVWRIPSVAAWTAGGEAVYVVARDAEQPLILSARRPGYVVRLLAIGTPAPRD